MKVLIAEDDLISRRLLEEHLRRAGFEVVATPDGGAAWRALNAKDAPRLAILDWMMPVMDGLDVCRRVRAAHHLGPVYLILLTAKGEHGDKRASFEAGADDYLTKPTDAEELRFRLSLGTRTLHLHDQIAALESALVRVQSPGPAVPS